MANNYNLQKGEIDYEIKKETPASPKLFKDMDLVLRSLKQISLMRFDDIELPQTFPFCSLRDLSKLVRDFLETKNIQVLLDDHRP